VHLLVIGATGRTGRLVIEQAVARGHRVTAFVRSPDKLGRHAETATIVRGDPRSADDIAAALAGCDAVISALGPPIPPSAVPKPSTILGDAAKATALAMATAGVSRLVIMSGDLMFPNGGMAPLLVRVLLLRYLAKDQAELERATTATSLDWTIVRPTRLTDGALTKEYRAERDRLPDRARSISRADVAHFLITAAEQRDHVQQIVGLAR
jgi:putative NADH-flavin reductase